MIRQRAVFIILLTFGLSSIQPGVYFFGTSAPNAFGMNRASTSELLTPLELLKNDKEGRSILVKASDPVVRISDSELRALATVLAQMAFAAPVACEISTVSALEQRAFELGLPAGPERVRAYLVALRRNDLMDDVILEPLLKILPAYAALAHTREDESLRRDPLEHSRKWKASTELFKGTQGKCPTDVLQHLVKELRRQKGRSYKRRQVFQAIRQAESVGVISHHDMSWLNALYAGGWDKSPYTLASVAPRIKISKNSSLAPGVQSEPSSYVSRMAKKSPGLTKRMQFYSRYDGIQILLLSQVFERFQRRVKARDAEVRLDEEIRKLTETEQLGLCQRWLHVEIADELPRKEHFLGMSIPYEDVMLAGLETGQIAAKDVELVQQIDDLWNPEVLPWKKVLETAIRLGGPAAVLVPFPYNTAVSITILVVQNFVLSKGSKPRPDEQGVALF